ncbi:MAG: DNA polymerase III subunit gamma/tau [Patescibacteria group bacterium]
MGREILYQKYRPKKFKDIIGQDHIVKVLQNEVLKNNIANGYLFFGPRGLGKTSIARIFANAINCSNPQNGEICGECSECMAIQEGSFIDLIEIDAASNRGIDDIRDIRSRTYFTPVMGKFKVYIIDEVHMLTPEAFNGLLKILEEPPSSVVFILATTEVHKVPKTIVSRCQRFDFNPASREDILKQINSIIKEENLRIKDEIRDLIVAKSEGSFRDSLTNMQKIINVRDDMSYEEALSILGVSGEREIFDLWNNIFEGNIDSEIDRIEKSSMNVATFIKDSLDIFRKVLIYKVTKEDNNNISELNISDYSASDIVNIINILIKALDNLRISSLPTLSLEIALVEVINSLSINNSIGNTNQTQSKSIKKSEEKSFISKQDKIKKNNIDDVPSKDENLDEVIRSRWIDVIEGTKPFNHHMSGFLSRSAFEINNNNFTIIVPFQFYKDMLMVEKSKEHMFNILKNMFNINFKINVKVQKDVIPILSPLGDASADNPEEPGISENDLKDVFDVVD